MSCDRAVRLVTSESVMNVGVCIVEGMLLPHSPIRRWRGMTSWPCAESRFSSGTMQERHIIRYGTSEGIVR
jgi:hypothetical protein